MCNGHCLPRARSCGRTRHSPEGEGIQGERQPECWGWSSLGCGTVAAEPVGVSVGLPGWEDGSEQGQGWMSRALASSARRLGRFTSRDANDDETDQASQQQLNALHFLPPKPLQQEDAGNSSWKLHCPKSQLCQVDVQAKICHIEAQPVVDNAVCKPEIQVKWNRTCDQVVLWGFIIKI